MSVSGRKSKMTKGRLDGAVVQFTNTEWLAEESKGGKDVVNFSTIFTDADGQEHPRKFYLGDQRFVRVNDAGGIESVDESRNYTISMDMATGKLLSSLEDAGFSGKKLDQIGDEPGVVDGQWVKLKEVPSGSLKSDGVTQFTDLLVDELVDDPTSSGSGKKKGTAGTKPTASAVSTSAKKKAAPVVDDDDDDDNTSSADDDDDDSSADDPIRAAAVEAMEKILTSLSTKTPLVKNFDSDAANGGITMKQAYTASFGVLKGKDVKGPASNMINDAAFHLENAAEGLYRFKKSTGVITPND